MAATTVRRVICNGNVASVFTLKGPLSSESKENWRDDVRAGLVGLGRMGARHATVLKQCGLAIAAIADINPAACEAVGSDHGIPHDHRFTSARDLVERVRPELLVVATTAPDHHDLVVAAAAHGAKLILCEKPMATSLGQCAAMVKACDSAGVKLAINHQMRFMEQYTIPKALCKSEDYGGLCSVIVSGGNFGLAMNGTHYFEMFRFLTEEEPVLVSAWFSSEEVPNPRGKQFKDAAGSVRLETASGKRFYLDCSSDQGHGMQVTYNCRNGRITIDELAGSMSFAVRDAEHREQPTTRYGMPYSTGSQTIAPADAVAPTRSVLEALLAGRDFPTGQDGHLAMKLLVAAHLSNERGGMTIDLRTEELPWDRHLPIA